jgi:hypothetical protein
MTLPDYAARLRKSQKFLAWHPNLVDGKPVGENRFVTTKPPAVEKYFSPKELADAWGVDTETIRYVFTAESGVVKVEGRVSEPKRSRSTLRIPESVAVRVHRRHSE